MGLDKTMKKNWVEGDTFAIKIENAKPEYNGRYIILIKHDFGIKDGKNDIYFWAKLTPDDKIPTTLEEVNALEYIKTEAVPYEARLLPIDYDKTWKQIMEEDAKKTYYPDEYNYLNEYRVHIWMKRGLPYDEFVYIGNYDVEPPKDEYISENYWTYFLDKEKYFVNKLLLHYENYNLRQSTRYTEEGAKKIHETYKMSVETPFIYRETLKQQRVFKHINGWGAKLYESDVAMDIKADYEEEIKNNKENIDQNEKIKRFCDQHQDIIDDEIDGPVFWIVLADQEMKNKTLNSKAKRIALMAIEDDLENWKNQELYEGRKAELDKFKKKLEETKVKE